MVTFYDDVTFINGAVIPGCRAAIDAAFPGSYSIEFLLSGRMYYGVDGGPRTILSAPTAFWHCPSHTYQYGAVDKDGWHHHWVLMKGPRARRYVERGLAPLSRLGYLRVVRAPQFAAMFRRLVELARAGDPVSHAEAVLQLESMLCMLMAQSRPTAASSPYGEHLERLTLRMREHPERGCDLPAEARAMGLSYSRLRHLFTQHAGKAPHDYLLTARMRAAAERLQDKAVQVKAVAVQYGYDDVAQFSKMFRKKIGLAPSAYRHSVPHQ
ncbi:MAG: AraC family transcriptional regulator [Kiritimatiellae bacterium]|nr:AraC family transcriptional regulator [Kiritimatiellia bacterium]